MTSSTSMTMMSNLLNTPPLLSLAGDLPPGLAIRIPIYGLKQRLQRPTILPEVLGFLPLAQKLLSHLGCSPRPTATHLYPFIFTPLVELDYTTLPFVDNSQDKKYTVTKEADKDELIASDHVLQYELKTKMKVFWLDWRVKLVVLVLLFSKSKDTWILDSTGIVINHDQPPHILPPGVITVFTALTPFSLSLPDFSTQPLIDNFADSLISNQFRHQRFSTPGYHETPLNLTQMNFHVMLILWSIHVLQDMPYFMLGGVKLLVEGAVRSCFEDYYIPATMPPHYLAYILKHYPHIARYWSVVTEKLKHLIKCLTQKPLAQQLPPDLNHILYNCLHLPCTIARDWNGFAVIPRRVMTLPRAVVETILIEQMHLTDLHLLSDSQYYLIEGMPAYQMQTLLPTSTCVDVFSQDTFSTLCLVPSTELWCLHLKALLLAHPAHLPLACASVSSTQGYTVLTSYFEQTPQIETLHNVLTLLSTPAILTQAPVTHAREIAFSVLFCHQPFCIAKAHLPTLHALREKYALVWLLPPIEPIVEGPARLWVNEPIPADMVLFDLTTRLYIDKYFYQCATAKEPIGTVDLFWFLLMHLRPVIQKPVPLKVTIEAFGGTALCPPPVETDLNPDALTKQDIFINALFTAFSDWPFVHLRPAHFTQLYEIKQGRMLPRMANPIHNTDHLLLPPTLNSGDAASNILVSLLGLVPGKRYIPTFDRQFRLSQFKAALTSLAIPPPRLPRKRIESNLDLHLEVVESDSDED
jgi:hypothetical protein